MATAFGVRLLGILLANSAKLLRDPEGRRKLAGGEAKRSHRKRNDSITRPERALDRDWSYCEFRSGVPAGTRTIFFNLSRWLRFAPPPANFLRLSGAENNFARVCQQYPKQPRS